MGGYQLMVSADIFRGRYRESFETPKPIAADKPLLYRFALPTANHVFLPGHRHHGAGPVELVPALRPQPADVRAQHLLGEAGGLPEGGAADLSRARAGELRRAAAGGVPLTGGRDVRQPKGGESSRPTHAIRPVRPKDFPRWLPLWDGYNAFYGREGPTALPLGITRLTWKRFLDPAEPVHALVAERGGELIGLTHYLFHRSTILEGSTCYLQDLFTSEASRGQGVARALILAVYEAAAAAGSTRVYWQTHETNARAMMLYDKVADRSGFVVYRKSL